MGAKKKFGLELGRMRLGTIPYSANQRAEINLAQGMPKDYFLFGLFFRLRYRLNISGGTTNGTITAEAGQNLIERIEISGNHKALGDYVRYLLQGTHAYQRANLFDGHAPERTGVPASGAIANSDIAVSIPVWLAPPNVRPEEQLLYLLDCPAWNTLNLYVDWGGIGSLVSGGDRTVAIQGFGGVGNPELLVTRIIAKLKGDKFKLATIPIKSTYRNNADMTGNIADGVVSQVNVGNFIRSVMLVTGAAATGGSAATRGDNFLTLSDAIYTRVKMKKDDVAFRDVDWVANQQIEAARKRYANVWPTGYNLFDFVEDETVVNSLDTRAIALQNLRLELAGDVTGAANQKLHVVYDELAGVPVFED